MRIVDNQMSFMRPPEMAADRSAALRQTGLNTGTLQEIRQDNEEDAQSVRDRPEVERAFVRTDAESESGGQEGSKKERDEEPPENEEEQLRRKASERFLNLPVVSGKDAKNEASRFDMRV